MTNCKDCDNLTNGKCCHESIRQQTEVTGNDSDIKREFERIERKQKYQPLFGTLVISSKEV